MPGIQRWPRRRWQPLRWRCCQLPSRFPAEIGPNAENQNHAAGRLLAGLCLGLGEIAASNSRDCRSDDGRQLVDAGATQELAGGGAEEAHVKGASRRAILIAGGKPGQRLLPVERGSAPAHPAADRLDGFVGRADKLVGIARFKGANHYLGVGKGGVFASGFLLDGVYRAAASSAAISPPPINFKFRLICSTGQFHQARLLRRVMVSSSKR